MLVPPSEYVEGQQPMEVAQARIVSTVQRQPVKDTLSTRFTWKIENFSRLNTVTNKHYSDVFLVGSYKWQVSIFLKRNNEDYLSLYLDTADSANMPYAEFSLAVVNQIDNTYTVTKGTQHQFTAKEHDGGFDKFMLLSKLNDPDRGYIVNDTCIVVAEVSICRLVKKQKVTVPMVIVCSSDDSEKSTALSGESTEAESQSSVLSGKSTEAVSQAGTPVKVEVPIEGLDQITASVPESEMQTNLDGKTNEPLVVVEESSINVQLTEQVANPATPNAVTSPVPLTCSSEIAPSLKYPDAGQLFEEGRHCQDVLDEKFENVGGFSILKTHASLYQQIWLKYGHIASSQVLKALYPVQVTLVGDIMTFVMDMYHCRLTEVSPTMIDLWENKIKMAEILKFNIRWLRERFEDVKKDFSWEQELKTTILLEKDQSIQTAQARLTALEDELKKARENLFTLQTERQMYLEKGNRLLFDGLF